MNRSALSALERRFRHYVEMDTQRDKVRVNLIEIAIQYEKEGKLAQVRAWLELAARWKERSISMYP